MKKKTIYYIVIDIIIVFASFLLCIWLKPGTKSYYLPNYLSAIIIFVFIWLFVSIIFKKYNFHDHTKLKQIITPVLTSNFTILAIASIIIYTFQTFHFSRLIFFGTLLVASIIELLLGNFYYFVRNSNTLIEASELKNYFKKTADKYLLNKINQTLGVEITEKKKPVDPNIKNAIIKESGEQCFYFISKFINLSEPDNLIISTTTKFNIEKQPDNYFNAIINLKRINDIRWINKFFEAVNSKLPFEGIFIGCAETINLRKKRILNKHPMIFNYIYYFFDFVLKRIFPKFILTKKFYFFLTRGQNRVFSRAEILGRLCSCGFALLTEKFIDNYFYFVAWKIKKPVYDHNPTYGPVVKLKRIGKNGKILKVYKLRTMHPYSEYLQDYMYNKNNLQDGGKFRNDFRVSTIGRIMRKFFIDEIPMLYNFFKGDLKLFGIRPLSEHYYNLYTKEHKERRLEYNPGLVPPFYVDLPKSLDEIMASELRYLEKYDNHPFLTDFGYFWKAGFNIIFRKIRSH